MKTLKLGTTAYSDFFAEYPISAHPKETIILLEVHQYLRHLFSLATLSD